MNKMDQPTLRMSDKYQSNIVSHMEHGIRIYK